MYSFTCRGVGAEGAYAPDDDAPDEILNSDKISLKGGHILRSFYI